MHIDVADLRDFYASRLGGFLCFSRCLLRLRIGLSRFLWGSRLLGGRSRNTLGGHQSQEQ